MVKVLDPAEGDIIGVFNDVAAVPNKVPNRWYTYYYPKEDCEIIEVTDPNEHKRLLPSLQKRDE